MSLEKPQASSRFRQEILKLPMFKPHTQSNVEARKRNANGMRDELLGIQTSSIQDNAHIESSGALTAILERNRRMQDALSDDLLMHAQRLKETSSLFETKLKEDADVLSDAYQQLDGNVAKLEKERRQIKQFSSKSWRTTLITWIAILAVCLIFVFVFFYMRVFSKKR